MKAVTLFIVGSSALLAGAVVPDETERIRIDTVNIPRPHLAYKSKEDYKTASGDYTRYNFTITNRREFPDELFKPSPDLLPIGLNKRASRTVVTFYDGNGQHIQGFVTLGSNSNLDRIWIAAMKGQAPPEQIYVEFHDRMLDTKLKSDLVKPGVVIVP